MSSCPGYSLLKPLNFFQSVEQLLVVQDLNSCSCCHSYSFVVVGDDDAVVDAVVDAAVDAAAAAAVVGVVVVVVVAAAAAVADVVATDKPLQQTLQHYY